MNIKHIIHPLITSIIIVGFANFEVINQSFTLEQAHQTVQAFENQMMQSQTPPDRGLPRRRESGSTGFKTLKYSHIC
ncbi:MAG: hypothetical protein SAK29_01620 [Scytonema sp. PMC 1069.18]|nr:hypothetical protein [Scytonema sp. PMC 1069.18]MEC4880267.1 hypothetical protein [Scytonema sp. PMC 1070.18]